MAVHLSIHAGYDPSYPWKQIGTDSPEKATNPLGYYLTPVDAEGEPPGVWHGRAAQLLGLADGELVDRAEFEELYGTHVNPRSGEHLGRAMYKFKAEDDIYHDLLAAEPYASEVRKAELRSQARRLTRRAVPYFDFTMSMSKDISLIYGSLLAKEHKARQEGDPEAAAQWAEKAAKVPAAIEWAREQMMDYLQDEAGYTRTGGHRGSSGAESSSELGKFEGAHDWLYASFFQHTSRDGDPQLHIHNLVLNKVPLMKDGEVEKWLTIDAKVAYSMRRAAAAVAAAELEARLSADLGIVWEPRPDGNGRQIAGVSQAMMDLFSHRRQTIKAEAAKLAAEREAVWGKAPTARQMDRMMRDITQKTRKAKESGPLDLAGHLREWAEQAASSDVEELDAVWNGADREGERYRARREVVARTANVITAEVEQRDGRPVSEEARQQVGAYAAYITRNGELAGPADPVDLAAGYIAVREADTVKLVEASNRCAAEDIVARTAQQMGHEFAAQTGRAPDAAEFGRMERFASWITRAGKDQAQFDAVLLLKGWQAQESGDALRERDIRRDIERAKVEANAYARAEQMMRAWDRAVQETGGGRLGAMERAYAVAYPVQAGGGLTQDQARETIARALETAQSKKTKWPKADLIARISEAMPRGAQTDRETLAALADQALAGGAGGPVVLLDPPQWPVPPASLRRPEDGESVFVRHGTMQYAAQAQLTLEETLLAQAQAPDAPRLLPDLAAQLLGADPVKLAALLGPVNEPGAEPWSEWRAECGLRSDQAAAAFFVLTSARRAEVLAGPAGTGKTRTGAELAKVWSQAQMGPVVALTTTSAARDVIRAEAERHAAPMDAYNTAEWLGHLPHAREARPAVELQPGTLLILDEASMMTVPDVASIMRRAAENGAKVVLTGDPEQLQAPEAGGGMTLLASRLGWVQLTEPQRFTHAWERAATLRLRDGDVTVLTDYRQQGRLHSGNAERTLDAAARAWLHDHLNGKDALLMTADEATAAELGRRVRDDLMHWGKVSAGPVVRIRGGQHASAGDLIMARRNDKLIRADREQGITNRDVLRITSTDPHGTGQWVQVQRLTNRDDGGQEVWSEAFDLPAAYVRADTQLAYAVTFHSAEGATVDSGISVFTGTEDRQAVNVGMTRGRESNQAYVITSYGVADPDPGTRSAPELDRYKQTDAERQGLADKQVSGTAEAAAEAETILAQCLTRDGRETSALEYQAKAWSNADRLDVLAVQWQHVTRPTALSRYAQAAREALPEAEAEMLIADPAAETLWRTLREAEAAGLSPAETIARAAARGPLDTAESMAKVIDWRIKQVTTGLAAQPVAVWSERVPQTSDADTDRYAAELAAAMDDRTRRLGEHAAEHPPTWATALGPVPEHPLDRADWEAKAAQVAAYREMWGHSHPFEPIGAAPGQHSPEARAMWQAAAQALGYTPDTLYDKTDGNLWARRAMYEREMAWQPTYAADKLAAARRATLNAQLEADRAWLNAQAADSPEARERLEHTASTQNAIASVFQHAERHYVGQQEAYDAWDAATRTTRDYAIAADAELRRRHPDDVIPLLTSNMQSAAETGSASGAAATLWSQVAVTRDNAWIQLGLDGTVRIPEAEASEASGATEAPAPVDADEPEPVAEMTPEAWAQDTLEGFPAMQPAEPKPALVEAASAADPVMASREAGDRAADILSLAAAAEDPDAEPDPAWAEYRTPGISEKFGQPVGYIRHDPAYEVDPAGVLYTIGQPSAGAPQADAQELAE